MLNNPEFNKAVLAAFMQRTIQSIKPVEEGSELAEMGFTKYGIADLTEFNYRFTMNAESTGFDVEEADGFEVLGFRPSDPGTDMGDIPGMEEGGGPEKPDIDGDGKHDEPPTTSNSDSKLLTLLLNAVAGKSFDKLSLTLLDDLTTTMSISDCSRALQLVQESAQARRRYADQATIDQYTQQLNQLIKAEMTCKGVSQAIPMTLVTQKFGVDYWTMPAFNFADENGYVSLIDLLDAESVTYGINIIDHAAEPMQQSIIVVRQLLQYFQTLMGTMQQPKE